MLLPLLCFSQYFLPLHNIFWKYLHKQKYGNKVVAWGGSGVRKDFGIDPNNDQKSYVFLKCQTPWFGVLSVWFLPKFLNRTIYFAPKSCLWLHDNGLFKRKFCKITMQQCLELHALQWILIECIHCKKLCLFPENLLWKNRSENNSN